MSWNDYLNSGKPWHVATRSATCLLVEQDCSLVFAGTDFGDTKTVACTKTGHTCTLSGSGKTVTYDSTKDEAVVQIDRNDNRTIRRYNGGEKHKNILLCHEAPCSEDSQEPYPNSIVGTWTAEDGGGGDEEERPQP